LSDLPALCSVGNSSIADDEASSAHRRTGSDARDPSNKENPSSAIPTREEALLASAAVGGMAMFGPLVFSILAVAVVIPFAANLLWHLIEPDQNDTSE
jgi:hypothetical protein